MKRTDMILAIFLFIITGCAGGEKPSDNFIVIDVAKSYPKKELILQDIFDVEYIVLETNDEFVSYGLVGAIGKEIIVLINGSDILIFDRNGKGLRKINRRGQGPEEYIDPSFIALDEENNEMIITDIVQRNIVVYDLFGSFKQRLRNDRNIYGNLGILDRDHFIIQYPSGNFINGRMEGLRNEFFIISRKDGSITKEIEIPFNNQKWGYVISSDGSRPSRGLRNLKLIPNRSSWIVAEISSDTIYRILPDFNILPIFARTPSIQSMSPEVYLFPSVISDHYYFLQAVKSEFDFSTYTGWPTTDLVYDRQEKVIFEYVVYNDDFLNKNPVKLSFESRILAQPVQSNEIAFFNKLESHELVEAYQKDELKGKLKEIASKLDIEDNPVIMIAKYKE